MEHDGEVDRLHGGGDVLLLLASSYRAVQVEQAPVQYVFALVESSPRAFIAITWAGVSHPASSSYSDRVMIWIRPVPRHGLQTPQMILPQPRLAVT